MSMKLGKEFTHGNKSAYPMEFNRMVQLYQNLHEPKPILKNNGPRNMKADKDKTEENNNTDGNEKETKEKPLVGAHFQSEQQLETTQGHSTASGRAIAFLSAHANHDIDGWDDESDEDSTNDNTEEDAVCAIFLVFKYDEDKSPVKSVVQASSNMIDLTNEELEELADQAFRQGSI